MKRGFRFFAALCLVFNGIGAFAQDIHFSQPQRSGLVLNPAYAGAMHAFNATLQYKDQWTSVERAYRTGNVTADMRLTRDKSAAAYPVLGLNVSMDRAGLAGLQTMHALLAGGYRVKTGENSTIGAALNGGFIQHTIETANLSWGNQFDGFNYNSALPSGEIISGKGMAVDLGAGLTWTIQKGELFMTANNHRHLLAGVSVQHINRPRDFSFSGSGERLHMRYAVHAEGIFGLRGSHLSVEPLLVYMQQGGHSELLAGGMGWYAISQESKITGFVKGSAVALGLYYRNRDALIGAMAFRFDRYSVGMSYDINTSALAPATGNRGGLEIFIRFNEVSSFLWKSSRSF